MSLITLLGGSGFIGSAIARRLTEKNLSYVAPNRSQELAGLNLGAVMYCVGLTADFRSQPLETVEAHVCHLLPILRDCEFRSLVYLSSTRVYRNHKGLASEDNLVLVGPSNQDDLYGISKLMDEAVVRACGRKFKIVRLSNQLPPLQGKSVLDINAMDGFSPLRPKAEEALGGLSHWITTSGRWIWLPIVSIGSNARTVEGLG